MLFSMSAWHAYSSIMGLSNYFVSSSLYTIFDRSSLLLVGQPSKKGNSFRKENQFSRQFSRTRHSLKTLSAEGSPQYRLEGVTGTVQSPIMMDIRKRPREDLPNSSSSDQFKTPEKRVYEAAWQDFGKWGVEDVCRYLRQEGHWTWEDTFRGSFVLISVFAYLRYLTTHI